MGQDRGDREPAGEEKREKERQTGGEKVRKSVRIQGDRQKMTEREKDRVRSQGKGPGDRWKQGR